MVRGFWKESAALRAFREEGGVLRAFRKESGGLRAFRKEGRVLWFCSIVVVALGLAGCAPAGDEALERRSELAIRSLMAAWESADSDVIEELFSPQATYDDFASQHTHRGVDEIVGYVLALHDWADQVYWNVGRVHVTGDGAVAEWVFSAIQARPLGSRVPEATGREVVLNGVTIIEMDGDRIVRAADYVDTGPMLLQLGARVETPGGGVIEMDLGN